jgi:hypothetical protein
MNRKAVNGTSCCSLTTMFLCVCVVFRDEPRLLPLVHKMHVCSDCPYESSLTQRPSDSAARMPRRRSGPARGYGNGRARHISPTLSSPNPATPRCPVSLFNLARRSARKALMASGRNVVWATDRLEGVPPAVKGILLLKDCELKQPPASLVLSQA